MKKKKWMREWEANRPKRLKRIRKQLKEEQAERTKEEEVNRKLDNLVAGLGGKGQVVYNLLDEMISDMGISYISDDAEITMARYAKKLSKDGDKDKSD